MSDQIDQQQTDGEETVGGVFPPVLVRVTGTSSSADGTGRVTLYPSDRGATRSIDVGGEPVRVTQKELQMLTARYQVEVVEASDELDPASISNVTLPTPEAVAETEAAQASEEPVVDDTAASTSTDEPSWSTSPSETEE